jgi:hypothetical protein
VQKENKKISNFPDLKLIMKCLVDDGTYEALLLLNDQSVVEIMNLSDNALKVRIR